MSFFIANAWAAPAAPVGVESSLLGFAPILVFFVVAYFLLMRPQQKRMKDHRALISSLTKGDEVVTGGGLMGRVVEVGDTFITLEIAPNVVVRMQKVAVQSALPKGTLKS